MNKLKKKINKIIAKTIDLFSGSGLDQDETVASGEKTVFEALDKQLLSLARECPVLLKNDGVLPINGKVALFGRCQIDWFYVGNGSGGDVKPPYTVNLLSALENTEGVSVNQRVASEYRDWTARKENLPDKGWWGHWPFSYDEYPLDDDFVQSVARKDETAIIVIGRSAGEDRDNKLEKGSFYLTDEEKQMISTVTRRFEKVCLVLNIGNVIDFSFLDEFPGIGSVLIAWQLGQVSGRAVADILTGIANPSGKLPDTIAKKYSDYPSSEEFGDKKQNAYTDDIYVGYRYFETVDKNSVLFPFGFGLSYSKFDLSFKGITSETVDGIVNFEAKIGIKNISQIKGKETVQLYISAPRGALDKPEKVLVGFEKSVLLTAKQEQIVSINFNEYDFSSFDDDGSSGNKNSYILEKGTYTLYLGNNVRDSVPVYKLEYSETKVLYRLDEICCVDENSAFEISHNSVGKRKRVFSGKRDLRKRILDCLPETIPPNGEKISFDDVANGKRTLDEFVATLNVYELEALTRGEGGMHSRLGAKGNAGAIGGVIDSLRKKGVPAVITTDGPSGIRLSRYTSLYPSGIAIASTWNQKLIQEVFVLVGEEMVECGSDVLLSPGMNIHRNPLCGRNFEYFSEDPLLSGKIATSIIKGIQSNGISSACPKHFACNNQEYRRNRHNAVVGERALREIYLKGFEIAVKEGKPRTIMTSYNKINGVWSHYNYDLATTVLRNEWHFDGLIVTDWWMQKGISPEFMRVRDNAYRIRAGVDVLMPGNLSRLKTEYLSDKNLIRYIGKSEGITMGELQRSAKRTLELCLLKKKIEIGKN